MAGPPSAQDVADALAITLERQDASGAPWCPPRDGQALRRWVTDRSAPLGGGIRRVVRLVRLMAAADGRDYMRFLYLRLTALRARQFRSALQAAVAEGRLPTHVAMLTDTGLLLQEPALTPRAGAREQFEIDFAQMPRLAALLDFLHNALGFAAIADLLAPLLQRGTPAGSADEVARSLHAALNAWLSERLESANHIRQAQRMRAFLAGRGRVAPEAVDDESILLFWTSVAEAADDDRIEGFRLYRSAACALLRYRQASARRGGGHASGDVARSRAGDRSRRARERYNRSGRVEHRAMAIAAARLGIAAREPCQMADREGAASALQLSRRSGRRGRAARGGGRASLLARRPRRRRALRPRLPAHSVARRCVRIGAGFDRRPPEKAHGGDRRQLRRRRPRSTTVLTRHRRLPMPTCASSCASNAWLHWRR